MSSVLLLHQYVSVHQYPAMCAQLLCFRQIESRRVAVTGFLMLLTNFNSFAGSFMSSQSASQSSCVASSQVCISWLLTLLRPLLPCGYSYKASCGRPG